MRPQRSTEELSKALEHLHYEFSMLCAVSEALASGRTLPSWERNALLESFVVHVRTLIDFFYPSIARDNDVLAIDFFQDPAVWRELTPALSDLLATCRERAHKEIAHLTYARLAISPKDKHWRVMEIYSEIRTLMNLFLTTAGLNLDA